MNLRRRLTLAHNGRSFLERWGLVHERVGGFYLHHIADADPGIDLHDHPWTFVSIVLRGGYDQELADTRTACGLAAIAERWPLTCRHGVVGTRRRWSIRLTRLDECHRIIDAQPNTWTLVLRGPTRRTWGFYMPEGWIDWRNYPYEARRPSTSSKPIA